MTLLITIIKTDFVVNVIHYIRNPSTLRPGLLYKGVRVPTDGWLDSQGAGRKRALIRLLLLFVSIFLQHLLTLEAPESRESLCT